MRELVYYVAVTLDGFIAGPDGGDPSGLAYLPVTEDLIGFTIENYPETLPGPARSALGIDGAGRVFDTVLEGRSSYEVGLAAGIPDAYPHLRHLVFSTSMTSTPSADVELVREAALERVRGLKAEDGLGLWLVGEARSRTPWLPEIDRLVLKVNPSIIGAGIPLFAGPFAPTTFTLVEEVRLQGGVRVVSYQRVVPGAPQ